MPGIAPWSIPGMEPWFMYMLDYSLERNKLSFAQSIDFIGHHRGLAIGNGIVFYLMHAIVLVGWVLAPSYAVVAATLSLNKIKSS